MHRQIARCGWFSGTRIPADATASGRFGASSLSCIFPLFYWLIALKQWAIVEFSRQQSAYGPPGTPPSCEWWAEDHDEQEMPAQMWRSDIHKRRVLNGRVGGSFAGMMQWAISIARRADTGSPEIAFEWSRELHQPVPFPSRRRAALAWGSDERCTKSTVQTSPAILEFGPSKWSDRAAAEPARFGPIRRRW